MSRDKVIGKVGLTPRGDFKAGVEYDILDVVRYQGASYVSMAEKNIKAPTDHTRWMVLSQDGEDLFGGELTPETVIEPGKPGYWFAAPGTYPNAGGVTVTSNSAGIVRYDGVNFTVTEIASGWTVQTQEEEYTRASGEKVVIKKVVDVVGGVGTAPTALTQNIGKYYAAAGGFTANKELALNYKGAKADPAKLPLYSAIKSSNIVGGTQFIDDENGFVQYRVKTGQTLNVGEEPAYSVKLDRINYFETRKTYNLLENKYISKNSILNGTGGISAGTNYNVAYKVPVVPGQKYYIVGLGHIRSYVKYDASGNFIETISNGIAGTNTVITIPADTHFISYYLPDTTAGNNNADLSGIMLVKSDVAVPYLPATMPTKSEYFELKTDADKQRALAAKVYLNENKNVDRIKLPSKLDTWEFSGTDAKIYVTDEYLKSVGIKEMGVHSRTSTAAYIVQSGISRTYPTAQNLGGKYAYVSAYFMTDHPSVDTNSAVANGIWFKNEADVIVTSTIVKSKITVVKTGLYRVDAVVKLGAGLVKSLYLRVGINNLATNIYPIYISAPAFAVRSDYVDVETVFPVLEDGHKFLFSQQTENHEARDKTITQFQDKKVCLYGTSIEAGGYFKKVADTLNINYLNYGSGGGGILWSNDAVLNNVIMNAPTDLSPLKAWSATWSEKEAYLIAQGIAYTDQARLDCFDQNLLTNLDAELFIIGTTGINDRKSTTTHAFVIDKVNRQFDRATIYGAYNYVLRALFEAKPNARVIILGQHCFGWSNTETVNDIQREVAKDWCIPFLDWGNKMRMSNMPVTVGGVQKTVLTAFFAPDGAHPNTDGKEIMAEFLIRELSTIY